MPPCGVPSVVSWRTCFIHVPGFQPLRRMARSIGDVGQKPIVRNLIETALMSPSRTSLRGCAFQCIEALFNRIRAGPPADETRMSFYQQWFP